MGRKRTSKLEDKANMPENRNAGAELGLESSNLSSIKADLRVKSKNGTLHGVESQASLQVYSSKRKAGTRGTPVRKSQRLQSAALDAPILELQHITEEIIATDVDNDDDEEEEEEEPVDDTEVILEGKNLEEKVEYLLGVCKEHQEILDAFKSKMAKGTTPGEICGAGEVTYKSMYIDSQKKIEASVGESRQLMKKIEDLEEENHQLNKKLQHALGKIEVYEQGNFVPSNILEKWNAVFFCPSLGKDAETACNVSSEAIRGAFTALNKSLEGVSCAMRKKSAKETKN